jgi:predicted NAD-dependent protein-ADP-ribosyltransferase YbiA (DUF1768 family)
VAFIVDISSTAPGPAGVLSNFTARIFTVEKVTVQSMEGLLQSLKFEDPDRARRVRGLWGARAKGAGSKAKWTISDPLWWQERPMDRRSLDYQSLLDFFFQAMYEQCSDVREALTATGDATLAHPIGATDKADSILTENEFVGRLTNLRARGWLRPPPTDGL